MEKKIKVPVLPHVGHYLRKICTQKEEGVYSFPLNDASYLIFRLLLKRKRKMSLHEKKKIVRSYNESIVISINWSCKHHLGQMLNEDGVWYFNHTVHRFILENAYHFLLMATKLEYQNLDRAIKDYLNIWGFDSGITYDNLRKTYQRRKNKEIFNLFCPIRKNELSNRKNTAPKSLYKQWSILQNSYFGL